MKNKRGFSNFLIGILAVVVLAILIFSFNSTSTGKATFTDPTQTPGAVYGKIVADTNAYTQCVYLSFDDGWSVERRGQIEYLNIYKGVKEREEDKCINKNNVMEYHCSGNSVLSSPVRCPTGNVCELGKCVAK